ncbi:hypothetical protein B0A52_06899 [Exophiala mesophila]|uniref:Nuclear distribution protein RO10 n=1 Tax=Exophiala mesophila TaxID=212818 RepID=A0A438N0Q0_EXOME|nr:hypothetical protein B0A52_06899 [Exophiala mesophila]
MATEDLETAARTTLALLETRLRRLEFLLNGTTNEHGVPDTLPVTTKESDMVWTKLNALDSRLASLKKIGGLAESVVADIERLSSVHPDLFSSSNAKDAPIPHSEDVATLAAVVLSHASLFSETDARLSSLQTLQIPSAESSSKLLALKPRLDQCEEAQREIDTEIRELRERSARCLEWWVNVGVVGTGDLWENWESRITDVERNTIRREKRAKEEQGYL